MKGYALYAVTKHGAEIAARLLQSLPDADLYVSSKFLEQAPGNSRPLPLPMEPALRENFPRYRCHVFAVSVGAVVRLIAPLLESKKTDPAVVCVDDRAKFSICVLSGHIGRGNFYTQEIAKILNSIPVITTASDVSGTLTVDILGRSLGWTLEDSNRNVTRGCAAVVNEERVLFVQECGEPDWWPLDQKLPKGVEYAASLEGINPSEYGVLLIATDRDNVKETHPAHYANAIVYHPKTLILGLGCDKNIPFETLENGILKILRGRNLSLHSVKAAATADLKKDEPAFLRIREKYGWDFKTFPAELLDRVDGVQNPSESVKRHVQTRSVSEAAALAAAGAEKLLVPKQKYNEGGKNMTMAVSRIPHPLRP